MQNPDEVNVDHSYVAVNDMEFSPAVQNRFSLRDSIAELVESIAEFARTKHI